MSDAPPLGRRSSFSGGTIELNQHQGGDSSSQQQRHGGHEEVSNSSEWKDNSDPVVKSTDMSDVMQQHAILCTQKAMDVAKEEGQKKELHNLMAKYIKKEFDASYGGVWHCVVGRNFGSFVVHTSRTFIYFYLGQTAVLLFKAGSQAL